MNVRNALLTILLALLVACQSTEPSGPTPEMQEAWRLFLRNDPEWPARREVWLSGSLQDRFMLQEALYLVLVGTDEVADPERGQIWSRAAREYVYLGQEAVAFLEPALRQLTAEPPVDRVAVDRVATVLADLYAVPEMMSAVRDPEASPDLRAAAVRCLAWMDDEEAIPALLHVLENDPEWKIRASSVDALASGVGSQPVQQALVSALKDPDPLVREKAAAVLGRVRDRSVQTVLVDHLEIAIRDGDRRQAAALHEALCTSTGRFGARPSPEAWRRILKGEG